MSTRYLPSALPNQHPHRSGDVLKMIRKRPALPRRNPETMQMPAITFGPGSCLHTPKHLNLHRQGPTAARRLTTIQPTRCMQTIQALNRACCFLFEASRMKISEPNLRRQHPPQNQCLRYLSKIGARSTPNKIAAFTQ